jgi:hypothetical protein
MKLWYTKAMESYRELVPINVRPDGSPGAFRIELGPSWTI